MSDVIMQLAQVIQQELNTVSVIANNTANLQTVGYKSQQDFYQLLSREPTAFDPILDRQPVLQTSTKNGALQQTGRALDFALSGDGWFLLQMPEGQRLTRDGRFSLDPRGQLVSQHGGLLLGESGTAIVVSDDQIKLAADGTIYSSLDGQKIDRLRIVAVAPDQIVPAGSGLYMASGLTDHATNYLAYQNVLERSNVDMGGEMVRMMQYSRHIETVQRALATYNGILETGINQLGK